MQYARAHLVRQSADLKSNEPDMGQRHSWTCRSSILVRGDYLHPADTAMAEIASPGPSNIGLSGNRFSRSSSKSVRRVGERKMLANSDAEQIGADWRRKETRADGRSEATR